MEKNTERKTKTMKKEEQICLEMIQESMGENKNFDQYKCAKGLEDAINRAITVYFASKSHWRGQMRICEAEDLMMDMLVSWRFERYKRNIYNKERTKTGKTPKEENILDRIIDAIFSYYDDGEQHGALFITGVDNFAPNKKEEADGDTEKQRRQ